jgi:Peptidase family C25/Propeptide_C25/Peptidase family C25, C terminal ig-like domain/FlgD Ig-like domain
MIHGIPLTAAKFFTCSFLCALCLTAFAAEAGAEWYDFGGVSPEVIYTDAGNDVSVLDMTIGGFEAVPVEIEGETYYHIYIDKGGRQELGGMPDLPDVRRNLIIPDDRRMAVTFLGGDYIDYPNMQIAPSKGPISRLIDPLTVPYTFGDVFNNSSAYPLQLTEGHDPYIMRDYRAMIVDMNAFQYFPATRTLRVYTNMRVQVAPAGPGETNVLVRRRSTETIDPTFNALYENRFINYGRTRYEPVLEDGGMLIITPDAFLGAVSPLYDWKVQKGIPTKLVTLSDTGSSYANIRSYIQNEYELNGISFVLLIGDAPQLTPYAGNSDPSYSLLAGSDNYPEVFIGRFSAENTTQVQTQVNRTIYYERDITTADTWCNQGMGVASAEGDGIGHGGQSDFVHEDVIRDKLMAYTYLGVDQIYDPGASASQVATAINEGRSITNYTGHGSMTSWGTTGFSNSHVNALTNVNKLPYIMSVACNNGEFQSGTCYAEAWLRASYNDQPTGAVAAYMSVISQSWLPPMDAQDEAVDLLVADQMRTVGGIYFNGSCLMMDLNTSQGPIEFKAWTIFGDPSLAMRTAIPQNLTVNYPAALFLGQDTMDIAVAGVDGALCALSNNGTVYGTGYTDAAGNVTITMDTPPTEPMTLTLTVTAYNRVTAINEIEVLPAEGPYLVVRECEYLDTPGLRTDTMHCGTHKMMRIKLGNVGVEPATGIAATLSTPTEGIFVSQTVSAYPDILPEGEEWNSLLFEFDIASDIPDGTIATIHLTTTADGDEQWDADVNFIVESPDLVITDVLIDDSVGGDGNYRLDPGETATIAVTLFNAGHGYLDTIEAILSNTHPQITVTSSVGSIPFLGWEESGQLGPIYEITVDPDFSSFETTFGLAVTGSYNYVNDFEIDLPIGGYYENIEGIVSTWDHYVVSGTFTDQWHLSTQRNHTTNGSQSWKCGVDGAGDYANLLDAGLTTPPAHITGEGELKFWMWIDSEISSAYPDRAYDGGLVEMSVDGGAFTQITPVGGYSHTIRPGSTPGPFAEHTPVFAGTSDWTEVSFDLGDTSGEVVFRFRFGSDGASGGEGWYIDDLEIMGLADLSAAPGRDLAITRLQLSAPQPNPLRGAGRISFALPEAGEAALKVYDASGRLVRTLLSGELAAGEHHVSWDGNDNDARPVTSGLYYIRLSNASDQRIRSTVLMR